MAVAQVSCSLSEAEEEGTLLFHSALKLSGTGGVDMEPRHPKSSGRQASLESDESTMVTAWQRWAQLTERRPHSNPQSKGPGRGGDL